MKRALTMIELIFVIVILGILAFISIPRLAATRDDAISVSVNMNLAGLITDVVSYYITQGEFAPSIRQMTYFGEIVGDGKFDNDGVAYVDIVVNSAPCMKYTIYKADADKKIPDYFTLVPLPSQSRLCTQVQNDSHILKYTKSKFKVGNQEFDGVLFYGVPQ